MCGELKWVGRVVLTVVAMVLAVAGGACAKVIYVDDDAPAGGDGSSWATAYTFLQDALTEAETTEETVEIRIAQGIYRPDRDAANPNGTGDRKACFELLSGLTLAGGYAGVGATEPNARDWEAYGTILTGDLLGDDATQVDPRDFRDDVTREDNSLNVVTARAFATLDGVVVTGGHALPYKCSGRNCPDVWPPPDFTGGGVVVNGGGVTLRRCLFVRNFAEMAGAGLLAYRVQSLVVEGCRFVQNGTGAVGGQGGGLYAGKSSVQIEGSQFFDNWANSDGAGLDCDDCELTVTHSVFQGNEAQGAGGAIYQSWGSASLSDCIVRGNSSLRAGGGCCFYGRDHLFILGCVFSGNRASHGGGLLSTADECRISSSVFSGNDAKGYGGAVCSGYSDIVQMTNCTCVGNKASFGSFLSVNHWLSTEINSRVCVGNCIIRNSGQEIFNINNHSHLNVRYTKIERSPSSVYDPANTIIWEDGNIDADPCFVDPGYWDANGTTGDPNNDVFVEGDYHLRSQAGRWDPVSEAWIQDDVTSPCIDAGDPNSRIGYEPFPNGGVINMGAYGGTAEASKSYFGQPLCKTPIAGDINGDCTVDFKDIAILLSHWLQMGKLAEEASDEGNEIAVPPIR